VAAWFGLLVTVFNLLPIGQLDGGHIVYALLGRQARYVSWTVIGALVVLGLLVWPGWILWAFLGWLSGRRQPVVLDQHDPLSRYSRVIAGVALVIFVLCFMPIPIQ
jgi:membrane-associated protease RseP (regulator of RpoE activity)